MAIPNGTKFHGVAPFVDTQNKGSDKANAMRDAYTIEEIASQVEFGATAILEPEFITATPGGSVQVLTTKNIIDLTWVGSSGTFDLILPSATDIPYRFLRIVNDATVVASDKVHVVAPVGETIDGAAFYVINKEYNGCAVWSDGNNWIVIQAKQ
jgi:hypothetical protein|eukprot:COSAG01_NODE_1329_length_10704_cov_34.202074_15_plen_154_part_00